MGKTIASFDKKEEARGREKTPGTQSYHTHSIQDRNFILFTNIYRHSLKEGKELGTFYSLLFEGNIVLIV